jgi:lysophospholipase L1-like esterase
MSQVPANRLKSVIFSLLPLLFLLVTAEGTARLFHLHTLRQYSVPIGNPANPLILDAQLLWSLKPNHRSSMDGVSYEMNSLGLRSPEVPSKREGEFRILSLGESTTYGVGVAQDRTYSAQLERILNRSGIEEGTLGDGNRRFRVINAGVSAYSSTQSVLYLKLRGLKLKPDMVLFYHEVNDYLPTTIRSTGNTEIGLSLSDKQLLHSFQHTVNRRLYQLSAFYRFLRNVYARNQIESFRKTTPVDPIEHIGLHAVPVGPPVRDIGTHKVIDQDMRRYPVRVSERERLENLSELVEICRRHQILLVVIHPSYAESVRHECLLTRFCLDRKVLMFEAYDSLHPKGYPVPTMFLDSWHPSAMGHLLLAEDLAAFLNQRTRIGADKPTAPGMQPGG